uniref:Transcription initiation factor TFIID subunit 13 n=1 Tax=Ditylenchus dipsaci TaxID=166011 RepID=A0A915ETM2_9BILA
MDKKEEMFDPMCLYDSDEGDENAENPLGQGSSVMPKKTAEERKLIFRQELSEMLYGFGDKKVALETTVDALEKMVIDYIKQVSQKALAVGKPGRIALEDVHYLIRRDHKKFNRVKELLSKKEEINKAKKDFEDAKNL